MLLDLDNKEDETSKNGNDLIALLNLDDYDAPKQSTPSGGVHYLFYVDTKQKDLIGSKTGIMYEGVKCNADAKFIATANQRRSLIMASMSGKTGGS